MGKSEEGMNQLTYATAKLVEDNKKAHYTTLMCSIHPMGGMVPPQYIKRAGWIWVSIGITESKEMVEYKKFIKPTKSNEKPTPAIV